MARTTRSTKGTAATAKAKADTAKPATTTTTYSLPPAAENPSRFFIVPKSATEAARVVTLQNPRYGKPTRYLVCPEAGFFEFNKIATPKSAPRSWLVQNARREDGSKPGFDAQVTSDPELYVATPIDPLFLLLPALASKGGCRSSDEANGSKKRMFLSCDDHLDAISEPGDHLIELLSWPSTKEILVARMGTVCDTVEAGDEQMFRLNESKLVEEILSKATRMSKHGLPKSMEEKFVAKALEAPILGIKSKPPANTVGKEASASTVGTGASNSPQPDAGDSQSTVSSIETAASSVSEASTTATSVSDEPAAQEFVTNAVTASPEVVGLQRLRVAFNFICSAYIGPDLAGVLKNALTTSLAEDFAPLDEYLAQLTKLRQDAAAARSTDYSRKRTMEEDDERAEKRRKKEEEDKARKANQSRGVKKLAKVNTSGMRKLSDFFKKK